MDTEIFDPQLYILWNNHNQHRYFAANHERFLEQQSEIDPSVPKAHTEQHKNDIRWHANCRLNGTGEKKI